MDSHEGGTRLAPPGGHHGRLPQHCCAHYGASANQCCIKRRVLSSHGSAAAAPYCLHANLRLRPLVRRALVHRPSALENAKPPLDHVRGALRLSTTLGGWQRRSRQKEAVGTEEHRRSEHVRRIAEEALSSAHERQQLHAGTLASTPTHSTENNADTDALATAHRCCTRAKQA